MAGDEHGAERLTAAEVAELLGVRRQTLWGYVARGQFPAPDGAFGPKLKWWWRSTVEAASRPGQGARTDLAGPRIGSLFSGYGGLDLAVTAVLGGRVVWHVETEPAAARCLAHHHPTVPNHGDITAVDFTRVGAVDVLTGGFPCQDISSAGRQAGLAEGTRSGLWNELVDAVRVLRPGLIVLENVAAILRRGIDTVASDLAACGYDLRWICLRASDVGACHRRDRWFAVAHPQDHGHQRPWTPRQRRHGPAHRGDAAAHPGAREDRPGTGGDVSAWGDYAEAVARWEHVLGRAAPESVHPGRAGGRRLSPRFVEWLMGLPDGYVTEVPHLARAQQLRLLGNGVVPQQAEHALRRLLEHPATDPT